MVFNIFYMFAYRFISFYFLKAHKHISIISPSTPPKYLDKSLKHVFNDLEGVVRGFRVLFSDFCGFEGFCLGRVVLYTVFSPTFKLVKEFDLF